MAAVRWMREQKKQGNFKGNVYEPARLSVSPKDPRYTDMAEGPISQAIFRVRSLPVFYFSNCGQLTSSSAPRRSSSRRARTTTS